MAVMIDIANYANILEDSINEIYIFSATTLHFITANRGARENLGYSLEELRQLRPYDIKLGFDAEIFESLIAPLYAGEQAKIQFETTHQRKDGSTYPVEVHLQLHEAYGEAVFVAIILNISERQKLISRMTALGHIVEDSLNEVYIFNAEMLHFIEVNRGARENLGYTLAELQQMTPLDIKHDYTLDTFVELVQSLHVGEEDQIVFETNHTRKDGSTYPVEVHLQLTRFGTQLAFVAIIIDTTTRKLAEQQLLELTLHNERAALVRNFMRSTSHDFRTPLATLSTTAYLLHRSGLTPKQMRYVATLEEQVMIMTDLVSALQNASVLENTQIAERRPLDLNAMLKQIYPHWLEMCADKHVDLRLETGDIGPILGDESLLHTAIFQLLRNACDYTASDSSVTITTRACHDTICLSVTDTGQGITEVDLPRIFDHLYRGNQARPSDGHSGLGLAIVRRIAQLHDGEVTVESQVGHGSTFTLKLPRLADDTTPPTAPTQ